MKKAIITGITGQDGAYLTELLLAKGYKVFGTYRRTSSVNFWRLERLGIDQHSNLELIEHDLTDLGNSIRLLEYVEPDELYNLAAQSFVGVSFEQPQTTAQISGLGVLNLLEAVRIVDKSIKFYQASTSEQFGKVQAIPQDENTPFYPRSPYAVAKLFAHWSVINYRESYSMFASNGILFNHESPLRGREFVTRKITHKVANIANGDTTPLELGNLDAKRDWGYAREYVEGIYKIIQHDSPDTFVLSSNQLHSVREFVELSFAATDVSIEWRGTDASEKGYDAASGRLLVQVNPKFYRPAEVELLIGDYSKAERVLNWRPETSLKALSAMMVASDLEDLQAGQPKKW